MKIEKISRAERDKQIVADYLSEAQPSLVELSDKYRLTKERIRQIVKLHVKPELNRGSAAAFERLKAISPEGKLAIESRHSSIMDMAKELGVGRATLRAEGWGPRKPKAKPTFSSYGTTEPGGPGAPDLSRRVEQFEGLKARYHDFLSTEPERYSVWHFAAWMQSNGGGPSMQMCYRIIRYASKRPSNLWDGYSGSLDSTKFRRDVPSVTPMTRDVAVSNISAFVSWARSSDRPPSISTYQVWEREVGGPSRATILSAISPMGWREAVLKVSKDGAGR